jgi:two-component system response regulator AtoC
MDMRQRILIVEDDEIFLRPLQRTLEVAGFEVLTAATGEDAIDLLKGEDVDLVLTDRRLSGMDGVELVRRLKIEQPELAVVVMTAHGTIGSAVEAMRVGAEDYLVKPFETVELLLVIRRAIEFQELKSANRATLRRNQERFTFRNIVARSAAMQDVFELLRSVAGLDTTVLIYGETGVGKEMLARSIHFSGGRRDRPFVAVNCAAIPVDLFESELFGFRKGAFTSASDSRRGLFQMANGGSLLLDEIGEMPLALQSKLLRVLEERRVTPIGSERPVDIDVRFIVTTNKDLQAEVERGTFRRDLFYRLSVMPIRVPALRERAEDIPLLAEHFLAQSARRSKKAVRAITPSAMAALSRYAWPGNVRELENAVERAVLLCESTTVAPESLPEKLWAAERAPAPPLTAAGLPQAEQDLSLKRAVRALEESFIRAALRRTRGNRTRAAEVLEISHRALLYKIKEYGIDPDAP